MIFRSVRCVDQTEVCMKGFNYLALFFLPQFKHNMGLNLRALMAKYTILRVDFSVLAESGGVLGGK